MLKKVVCGKCGQINVLNIHEELLGRIRDKKSRLFGDEIVEVTEVQIDNKICKGCGERLSI
jgi:ribosomal protein S27AE